MWVCFQDDLCARKSWKPSPKADLWLQISLFPQLFCSQEHLIFNSNLQGNVFNMHFWRLSHKVCYHYWDNFKAKRKTVMVSVFNYLCELVKEHDSTFWNARLVSGTSSCKTRSIFVRELEAGLEWGRLQEMLSTFLLYKLFCFYLSRVSDS